MALRTAQPASRVRPHPPMPARGAQPAGRGSTPAMPAPYQSGQIQTGNDPNLPPAWASDPILQQIQALAEQNKAAAEAGALAQRQQALIAYGYDPTLGGEYGDASTQAAAQQNPFSVLKNLQRQHEQRQTSLNENLNKQNLFYSSYRGTQLQNEGTQYLGEQSSANQALQGAFGSIAANLLSAKQSGQQQVTQAQQDAYTRYLQQQLANAGAPHAPVSAPVRARAIRRPKI